MLTLEDSHSVLDGFTVKVFLDTNILVYLVDDLYLSLNETILILQKNLYANLISSSFVVFEFVGVRKKEHFLRKILQNKFSKGDDGKFDITKVNLLSVLRYNDSYETDDASFDSIKAEIERSIEGDLNAIAQRFKVDFEKNTLHAKLLEPTKKLFLGSRISKEDCLVVSSAVWPDQMSQNDNLLLFSNDKDFVNKLNGIEIKDFFNDKSASAPHATYLQHAGIRNYNLTQTHSLEDLASNIKGLVKELIKTNNEKYYLGVTVAAPKNHLDIVAFSLESKRIIPENCVIVIVSKDLQFFFVSSEAVTKFQQQGSEVVLPFTAEEDISLAFKLDFAKDPDLEVIVGESKAIQLMRNAGHLVFIHPDSIAI
ncbi:MAG: hypothetical protein ACRYG7_03585 [Janthinobacterium lividum]